MWNNVGDENFNVVLKQIWEQLQWNHFTPDDSFGGGGHS